MKTEKPLRTKNKKEIWQIEELRAKINPLNIEADKLKIRLESKEQFISLLYNILNNSYIIKHDVDLQKQLKLFREINSIMGDFNNHSQQVFIGSKKSVDCHPADTQKDERIILDALEKVGISERKGCGNIFFKGIQRSECGSKNGLCPSCQKSDVCEKESEDKK